MLGQSPFWQLMMFAKMISAHFLVQHLVYPEIPNNKTITHTVFEHYPTTPIR